MISSEAIQTLNLIVNGIGVFILLPILVSVWNYKRRNTDRFDHIERRLDNILLLTNELYQSDKKEVGLDQEAHKTNSGTTIPKRTSRS